MDRNSICGICERLVFLFQPNELRGLTVPNKRSGVANCVSGAGRVECFLRPAPEGWAMRPA